MPPCAVYQKREFCGIIYRKRRKEKDMKKIHLIRHGITEGNLKRWHYGWADIPLAPEGIEKLKKLREENIYPQPENAEYYTSGMLRAEQTFAVIYGERAHQTAEKMKEMNFGEFEKKTYEELKDDPMYTEWMKDLTGAVSLPGGESKNGFFMRIMEGFKELTSGIGDGGELVCVCHGGVIACVMMDLFGSEMKEFPMWIPEPGRGYSIILSGPEGNSYKDI